MDPTDNKPKRKVTSDWRTDLLVEEAFLNTIISKEDSLARANDAGYSKSELLKAQAMIKDVWAADMAWENKQSEKDQQRNVFKQSFQNLDAAYMKHLSKARRIFESEEERGIARQLKLEGERPRKFGQAIDYILKFYSFALQEKAIMSRLKTRNISTELMEQMLNLTEEVRELYLLTLKKDEIAKDATALRNKKRKIFDKWRRNFKGMYKIAPAAEVAVDSTVETEKTVA